MPSSLLALSTRIILSDDDSANFGDLVFKQRLITTRLDVQRQQRLRVGLTKVETPRAEFCGVAVGEVEGRRQRREVGFDGSAGGGGNGYLEVDFADAWVTRGTTADQVTQGHAGGGNQGSNHQPRYHARVAISEVAEIMVRAHFAAVDRVLHAHAFLDGGGPVLDMTGMPRRILDCVVTHK